jgi:ABC-type antimicrobial peptide transport system permease subunit
MVLCFFILWLSFTANIHENAWEFGVLRAIGLNVRCYQSRFPLLCRLVSADASALLPSCLDQSFQVVMVYVYEALALVMVGVVLGTAVGMCLLVDENLVD